jgi:hypothetical protein
MEELRRDQDVFSVEALVAHCLPLSDAPMAYEMFRAKSDVASRWCSGLAVPPRAGSCRCASRVHSALIWVKRNQVGWPEPSTAPTKGLPMINTLSFGVG